MRIKTTARAWITKFDFAALKVSFLIRPIFINKAYSEVTTLEVGTCTGQWSTWDDRDNPSGTGDWEQIQFRHDADSLCDNPSAVQARVVETGAMETTQNVQIDLNGLVCQNNNQVGEMCWDYEVRVCCEGF